MKKKSRTDAKVIQDENNKEILFEENFMLNPEGKKTSDVLDELIGKIESEIMLWKPIHGRNMLRRIVVNRIQDKAFVDTMNGISDRIRT